ncbi:Fic family protein [Candidatus Bipolaricaulota bacterium]
MTQPGRLMPVPEGYSVFIPDSLPPELEWTSGIVGALSDADRAIGRLAGEGRRLPNPHVLMRPFVAREAVLSSRIEGTHATLGELLAAEAGAVVDRSPDDLREVANYVVALEHAMGRLPGEHLSVRLLLEAHAKLMTGVRGGHAKPGQIRDVQNWIGIPGSTPHTALYIPPPPSDLKSLLAGLEAFLRETVLPPLVQIALAHYQFEAIHPFLDGNGRVGRLLITLFLVERGVLPTPLLYLSAFFEATRSEYYARLRAVSEEGDWSHWILYFVNGVARQSEDAVDRAARMLGILDGWRLGVSGLGSDTPERVLDLLAGNPFVTARSVSAQLDVARTTASRAIEKLVDLGVLEQTDTRQRDRAYCARALLDVLEEPTKLAP